MEGCSRDSNGSGAQSQQLQVPVSHSCLEIEERKTESMKILEQAMNDSNAIWDVMIGKGFVFCRLLDEKTTVFRNLAGLHRRWWNRYYSTENIVSFHKLKKIYEQTQVLSRMLDEYDDKLKRAGGIIGGFFRDIESHTGSLKQCMERVSQAHTLSDLVQVETPNLKWIEAIPDSGIETLADEWEEMKLDVEISDCMDKLQML